MSINFCNSPYAEDAELTAGSITFITAHAEHAELAGVPINV